MDVGLRLFRTEGEDERIGALAIGIIPGDVIEPCQHVRQGAVARRRCIVHHRLRPCDDVVRIVRIEEVSTTVRISVVGLDGFRPGFGVIQITGVARGLEQQQGGAAHVGIVVENRRMPRLAGAPSVPQAVAVAHVFDDEIEGPLSKREPRGLTQNAGGARQRRDHQTVPIGQYLVVAAGRDALFSLG